MKRIAFVGITALILSLRALAAEPMLNLAKPVGAAATGGIRVDVLVLNESSEPIQFTPAPTLPCRITTADGDLDARLVYTKSDGALTLQPGQFTRVPYALDAAVVGKVTIALPGQSTSIALDVAKSSTEPAAASSTTPFKPSPIEAMFHPDPSVHSEFGLAEYLSYRIKAHEPIYFLGGIERPNGKFQFSFKYQVMGTESTFAEKYPVLSGLYLGYSQTSFWDLQGDSKPFFDNSYRPEVFYAVEHLEHFFTADGHKPEGVEFRLQAGFKHESNGRDDGPVKFNGLRDYEHGSRSLNIAYVRPIVTLSNEKFFITLAPTIYTYVGDLSDNDNIADYRGYGDIKLVIGQRGGVQLAAIGRVGDDWDKGSLELDLSFPLRESLDRNFDIYLYSQFFTGYGESLLGYDDADNTFRIGFALVR